MDLPTDYLQSLKEEAIARHQQTFLDVQRAAQQYSRPLKLGDDIICLICDFANPHYYYRLEQISHIPASMVLFMPGHEVKELVEYFKIVNSPTSWIVMNPDSINISAFQPSCQNFIIVTDCPPRIKREVVSQLYYTGVLYFGGFEVAEESLLDSCTLSVC